MVEPTSGRMLCSAHHWCWLIADGDAAKRGVHRLTVVVVDHGWQQRRSTQRQYNNTDAADISSASKHQAYPALKAPYPSRIPACASPHTPPHNTPPAPPTSSASNLPHNTTHDYDTRLARATPQYPDAPSPPLPRPHGARDTLPLASFAYTSGVLLHLNFANTSGHSPLLLPLVLTQLHALGPTTIHDPRLLPN